MAALLASRGEVLTLSRRAWAVSGHSILQAPRRLAYRPLAPSAGPVVSVVIPCFNHGAYVGDAVASAVAQTLDGVEVIVVEGGSTDGVTPARVRELEEDYRGSVRVLYRDRPSLLGDNRNFGIAAASGRYICCLDADDRLTPIYLDVASFLLEARAYDVVASEVRCFGDEDRVVASMTLPTLNDLLRMNWVAAPAVFRRERYEDAGGYRDAGLGPDYIFEDWRFWVRMAAQGARFANIPCPLIEHRVHSGPRLSQSPTLPGYARQRRAVAKLNEDVISWAARSWSWRERRLRVLAREHWEPTRPEKAGGALLVGGRCGMAADWLAAAEEAVAGGLRVVIASPERSARDWGGSTLLRKAERFKLGGLLDPMDWSDFASYLIQTKGLREIWDGAGPGSSLYLRDVVRRHPELPVISHAHQAVSGRI